jgi:prevent-host-death family protein
MYEPDHDHHGVRVSVSQARDDFAELVNRAAYKEERVIITRRGRAIAAIVPIEDVAYLERLEDEYDLKVEIHDDQLIVLIVGAGHRGEIAPVTDRPQTHGGRSWTREVHFSDHNSGSFQPSTRPRLSTGP